MLEIGYFPLPVKFMSNLRQNNNKKKIFLASSSDLKEERDQFEIFINRRNKQWYDQGIFFELVVWEDFLDAVSKTRKQEDYNKAIDDCDIFVMLFFNKVGKYTLEEFNIAYNKFKISGKPLLFTYFKNIPASIGLDQERSLKSLWKFQKKLDQLGHFYTRYKSDSDLQLHFSSQLEKLAREGFFGDISDQRQSGSFPKELTLNMPRIDPDEIIGREPDLNNLHLLLSGQKRVVVVNGLGGIGKTTLARAYLKKYYDEYHHICWITQLSEDITRDFVNTPGLMSNLAVEMANLDPADLFNAIIGKLKGISGRPNLLIIDNAEDSLSEYLDILPSQPSWHLLVTSRVEIMGLFRHQLDFLNEEQAIALFKKHYPYQHLTEDDIKALVAMVDRHTLAVEVLAKTAAAQRYDLSTLKEAFDKDIKSNIKVQHGTVEKIGTYLRSMFNLSKLNAEEIWVMKQFTCLPSEYNSSNLLFELIVDEEGIHAAAFFETLHGLFQKGWLLHDTEADAYKMHRVIADVVKQEQRALVEDVEKLVGAIAGKLHLDGAKENPVDKFQWIPFGRAVLAALSLEIEGLSILENNLALRLKDLGDYVGAKALLEKALQSDERNFGTDHPTTAISYSNLALVLQDLGDYAGAKALLEKAVQSAERNFGADHPTTGGSYSNLATVLQNLGDFAGAKALLEKAVQSAERDFGADHPTTVKRYSNLALILQNLGDYAGAKELLEKAVQSAERNFGTDHPTTATRYSNLALVLKDLGDYAGAKALLEKALQSDGRNFGADHPKTAIRYSNLSLILKDLGDYIGALELSEKALSIFKKILPEGHPYIHRVFKNYEAIKNAYKKSRNTDITDQP